MCSSDLYSANGNSNSGGSGGGIQFDISDSPDYLDLMSVSTTERTTGFSADFNNVNDGSSSRIVLYSQDNINLEAGQGPVVIATFQVKENAYADVVSVIIDNVTVTDGIGGSYWIASADTGSVIVTPGYIEPPSNLQAVDGQDAEVLLTWNPPVGPIFSLPLEITITTDNYPAETSWNLSTSKLFIN